MSFETYKVLHLLGIVLVFAALAGISLHVMNGGTKATNTARRLTMMTHGIGLVLSILGGFGQLAKLGIHSLPGWVVVKFVLWIVLAAGATIVYKKPTLARAMWFFLPLCLLLALHMAWHKPF